MNNSFLYINDLLLTPLYILIIAFFISLIKAKIKDKELKKYFVRGITIKIVAALIFSLVYAFLYGGDTYGYWMHGGLIYDAFIDSPLVGFKLLFSHGQFDPDLFQYSSKMYWYEDSQSFFVARLVGVISLFCFHTYTIIAIIFSVFAFYGIWHMFLVFRCHYPDKQRVIAMVMFYTPSLVFWGAGVMKDPLLIGAMGLILYAFYFGVLKKQNTTRCIILGLIAVVILVSVKPFVFAAFFPSILFCYVMIRVRRIKKGFARVIYGPIIFMGLAFFSLLLLGYLSRNTSYDLTNLTEVARRIEVTAKWINYVSDSQQGSSYNIGELDGTISGTLKLAPPAIWVALFRPYLWESKNVTMAIAAIESTFFLLITIYTLIRIGFFKSISIIYNDSFLLFCFLFSLFFAFIVGVSSFNFGTLVRYKIPLMPFYLAGVLIVLTSTKKRKKRSNLAQVQLDT